MPQFSSLEICSGAGGQALGLELAGFGHECLVEIEPPACATLRQNRPEWNVIEGDCRHEISRIAHEGRRKNYAPGSTASAIGESISIDGRRIHEH